jgi:hypothetical protein
MRDSKVGVGVVPVLLAIMFGSSEMSTARAQNLTINVPGVSVTDVKEFIADSVGPLTTVDLFTVPANRILVITDVLISGGCCGAGHRILRSGHPATGVILVPAADNFSHTFATGIIFFAGDTLSVRKEISPDSPSSFYLRGFLLSIP